MRAAGRSIVDCCLPVPPHSPTFTLAAACGSYAAQLSSSPSAMAIRWTMSPWGQVVDSHVAQMRVLHMGFWTQSARQHVLTFSLALLAVEIQPAAPFSSRFSYFCGTQLRQLAADARALQRLQLRLVHALQPMRRHGHDILPAMPVKEYQAAADQAAFSTVPCLRQQARWVLPEVSRRERLSVVRTL